MPFPILIMSAIKDGRYPIMLDKERHLLFSLNVLDELQDKAGGFDNLQQYLSGNDAFKNLRWLLTLLINEGAEEGEPELTEKQVGRLIHAGNLMGLKNFILAAFSRGSSGDKPADEMNDDDDLEEDDEKNGKSGRE